MVNYWWIWQITEVFLRTLKSCFLQSIWVDMWHVYKYQKFENFNLRGTSHLTRCPHLSLFYVNCLPKSYYHSSARVTFAWAFGKMISIWPRKSVVLAVGSFGWKLKSSVWNKMIGENAVFFEKDCTLMCDSHFDSYFRHNPSNNRQGYATFRCISSPKNSAWCVFESAKTL